MRVFLTGASGLIGFSVAQALARAGHDVVGLVRTQEAARRLAAVEVEPLLGDMSLPPTFAQAARRCQVLIHCATEHSAQRWELEFSTLHHLIQGAAEARAARRLIYTSGVWVYGDTGGEPADESTPTAPPQGVAPRLQIEEMVLRANISGPAGPLRTMVVRPGCVYGGAGGLTGAWFESALREGAARVVGDGHFRWAMVHVQDLADLFLRCAEAGPHLGGEIINACDRSRFTVLECARAASLAAGAGGHVKCVPVAEAEESMGPAARCLAMDQHIDAGKAERLLGWRPRHAGFVDGAARYLRAYTANQKARKIETGGT
jgi:nucleoside-diphosphate-sugar epimerase